MCWEHCIFDCNMKISLLCLRRRAELSAAEAFGSLGDHWFPDLPGAREDLPRERGVLWCGKLAAREEGVLFCLEHRTKELICLT